MDKIKPGKVVYIEEDDYLCPMRVNGYKDGSRKKVLSLIYVEGKNKGRSQFFGVEDIITDTRDWFDEDLRKELNKEIKEAVSVRDFSMPECLALTQILKIGKYENLVGIQG